MKKNVIFVIMDSMWAGYLNNTQFGCRVTPFLDSLAERSLFAQNMYSEGNYTESALNGLYFSRDTLDEGGYRFYEGTGDDNYLKLFSQNGYEIFESVYPTFLPREKTRDFIDTTIYVRGCEFDHWWAPRRVEWENMYRSGSITELDWQDLVRMFDLLFGTWLSVLSPGKKAEFSLLPAAEQEKLFGSSETIMAEFEKYQKDKRTYLRKVLLRGLYAREHPDCDHVLWKTARAVRQERFVNGLALSKKFWKENLLSCSILLSPGSKLDFIRLRDDWLWMCGKAPGEIRPYLQKLRNYFNSFMRFDPVNNGCVKASFQKQIDCMVRLLSQRGDSDRPFFYSIKAEETHMPLSYFTYDAQDSQVLAKDLGWAGEFLREASNLRGSLLGLLAARYVDLCFRRMFGELEKRGLLRNTLVVLTSDHGAHYPAVIHRETYVHNSHDETYRVPFIVAGAGVPACRLSGLYMNKDVFPTIADLCGIQSLETFKGKSILRHGGYDVAVSENLGRGYPDLRRKPICFSARDSRYTLGYQARLLDGFPAGRVTQLYDREADPLECRNLAGDLDAEKRVSQMSEALRERFEELKRENAEGLAELAGEVGRTV